MIRSIANLTHQRLRLILFILLMLTFCLPALIAGIGFYQYTKRMVTEDVTSDLGNLARYKADQVRDWITDQWSDLASVARLIQTPARLNAAVTSREGTRDSLRAALSRWRSAFGNRYDKLAVFEHDGQSITTSTDPWSLDTALLRAVTENGRALSARRLNHGWGLLSLELYVAIPVSPHESPLILAGSVPPKPLFELAERVGPGSSQHVHLVDQTGSLLNHRDSVGHTPPLAESEIRDSRHGQDSGRKLLRYRDERDIEIVGAYCDIPELGWKLLIERDYDEAFRRLIRLREVLSVVLVLIVLFGGAVSIAVARFTVSRLEYRERELRTTHQQLITADRLASVGMMAASVAHEINNPLTTIKVLIHSLREHLSNRDARRNDLGIVLTEIDKMKALVLRFLQFARPRDPEFSSVQLGKTLTRIVSLIRPQAQGKGLTLVERYATEAGLVWADAGQIGQVFLNILLNAVDATPSGGEIHVAMAPSEDETVVVTIWNSGPGLPDELRERIFEPFFSTKPTGTGLGLSIARTIVGKHQGTIRAEGHGEGGTSFIISLRASTQETQDASSPNR